MNTISVILATSGRETLQDAVDSVIGAHELHVIHDNSKDFGNTVRNEWMSKCTGTHIAFLDDDDMYTPDAIEAMVSLAHEEVPSIFRMNHMEGILWRDKRFMFSNFGTPCLVVPNVPEQLGTWKAFTEYGRGGDWMFIEETVKNMGGPHWCDHVVALIRPHSRGLL
jgi:glycosyltransferase involved in cell wall biosynthesis